MAYIWRLRAQGRASGSFQDFMKLIIQIPCLNESDTLAIALGALPREVPGFDEVEWLVIDDGSTDNTAGLARQIGVDHVIRHPVNPGMATAFMTGLEACRKLGRSEGSRVGKERDSPCRSRGSPYK